MFEVETVGEAVVSLIRTLELKKRAYVNFVSFEFAQEVLGWLTFIGMNILYSVTCEGDYFIMFIPTREGN